MNASNSSEQSARGGIELKLVLKFNKFTKSLKRT